MSMGIVPREHVTVPDDLGLHAAAITRLSSNVDLVISSGGLGPTADDLTRRALAHAMSVDLVEDPIALAQIEAWFGARGRPMPPLNRVQALLPRGAIGLANLNGTAPGMHALLRAGDHACDVFCLPGPPGEMHPMFELAVAPRLRPPVGRTILTRALTCFGIGESDLATRLGDLMARDRNPMVGTTASGGVVTIRIRLESDTSREEAERLMANTVAEASDRAGRYLVCDKGDTIEATLLSELRRRGMTLGAVESCTGGMLGQLLTALPGSSAVFRGGLTTYTNDLKTSLAGVSAAEFTEGGQGAVSESVARAMAVGGLERLGVSSCLAVTGIAGPDGATPGKAVGTVFIAAAVRTEDRAEPALDVRRFQFSGDRRAVREWSCRSAMMMLLMGIRNDAGVKLLRQAAP